MNQPKNKLSFYVTLPFSCDFEEDHSELLELFREFIGQQSIVKTDAKGDWDEMSISDLGEMEDSVGVMWERLGGV